MTVDEMKQIKKEYGYSNDQISKLSGVPLGTVQKIMSGLTTNPRYATLQALSKAFEHKHSLYDDRQADVMLLSEELADYNVGTSAKQIGGNTINDYYSLPDEARLELIDGKFYDMAAPTWIHQRVRDLIYFQLQKHVYENKGPCIPITSPLDVQLDRDDKTMLQPDILVVCDKEKIRNNRVYGAPDMVVEILSPSNWYNDMVLKLRKYKQAGVREYWIVNPEKKSVLVYDFERQEDFVEYDFCDKVPVGIWNGKCKINFEEINALLEDQYGI